MKMKDLKAFLSTTMSMRDVYQPVIIRELLLHSGQRTKNELVAVLTDYDASVKEYYRRVIMRWPKRTLTKHGIIRYEPKGEVFSLTVPITEDSDTQKVIDLCDERIASWLEKQHQMGLSPTASAALRYRVLRAAHGKCQLCGIPAELQPLDIDHVVPQSKANKNGQVRLNGSLIPVHSEANLQVLCMACNRGKRDTDATDFRKHRKLVRDRIPDIIKAEGRTPQVRRLTGGALVSALEEKLVEEHAEYIASRDVSELIDIVEVTYALARAKGISQSTLQARMNQKRAERGGFDQGYLYLGDEP